MAKPSNAALAHAERKYREYIYREDPRAAFANALVEVVQERLVTDLESLRDVAWWIDASVGFPEPDRIDAIAADVWGHVGPAPDDEDDASRGKRAASGKARDKHRKPGRKLRLKTWGGIPLVVLDDDRLSKTDIRAFGYVASHIATDGGKDYSYADLAERLRVTRREAMRAIASLTERGYLVVKSKGTGRRGNVYAFGPDALAASEVA